MPEPPAAPLPANLPSVAVFRPSSSTAAQESEGWLRYLLEQVWRLPYTSVGAGDIEAGALAGADVLLVPNGNPEVASNALGQKGRRALASWVEAGGRYVGWRGGAEVAARVGITSAQLAAPKSDVAGALLRVRSRPGSPLANGVGPFGWVFYDYDLVMQPSNPAHAAFSFPPTGHEDFFVSGFARGAEELGGTAAVIDEPFGDGRVVLLASDPNYRAWTIGMQKVLRNAILGADPAAAGQQASQAQRSSATKAAGALPALDSPIHLTVTAATAAAAEAVLRARGATFSLKVTGNRARFLVANPGELIGEEHPFAALLPDELKQAGVEVVALRVP